MDAPRWPPGFVLSVMSVDHQTRIETRGRHSGHSLEDFGPLARLARLGRLARLWPDCKSRIPEEILQLGQSGQGEISPHARARRSMRASST